MLIRVGRAAKPEQVMVALIVEFSSVPKRRNFVSAMFESLFCSVLTFIES